MREIKLRAWIPSQKIFSYFDLSSCTLDNGALGKNEYKEAIITQFTGLKDKNDKEIYEGDILEYKGSKCMECGAEHFYEGHKLYAVKWVKKDTCFSCENDENFMSPDIWHTDMEVIGNIYEHSQLLKEGVDG